MRFAISKCGNVHEEIEVISLRRARSDGHRYRKGTSGGGVNDSSHLGDNSEVGTMCIPSGASSLCGPTDLRYATLDELSAFAYTCGAEYPCADASKFQFTNPCLGGALDLSPGATRTTTVARMAG